MLINFNKLSIFLAAYTFLATSYVFSYNPITPEGDFLSDPAPRVDVDGVMRIFGSRDVNPKDYCSAYNDVYETKDLLNWRIHKGVFASSGDKDALPPTNLPLYAPDGIRIGEKWALFYCTPDNKHMAGVALSDRPEGPYSFYSEYPWARQIDPSVFRDDDGKIYYTWGQFSMKMAELKPDLSGFVPGTMRKSVIDEARHGFHEGSQLLKRGDTYYLVYSDISRRGRPTCIGYATSKSPYGPYVYRGVIIDNYGCDPKTWNNHGGIVEYNGRWYVFYHRSTNGSKMMRKACVEPIVFDENGFIEEVQQTSNGAGPALNMNAVVPARLACEMSGSVRVMTKEDGKENLGYIKSGDSAIWRYFDFVKPVTRIKIRVIPIAGGIIEVRDGKGGVYGRVTIPAAKKSASPEELEITAELSRPFPLGRQTIELGFLTANGFLSPQKGYLFDLESFEVSSTL